MATTTATVDASLMRRSVLPGRSVASKASRWIGYRLAAMPEGKAADQPDPCENRAAGGVAEWTNASVLKTDVGQPTVGSNPTPSASLAVRTGRRYTPRFVARLASTSDPGSRRRAFGWPLGAPTTAWQVVADLLLPEDAVRGSCSLAARGHSSTSAVGLHARARVG